MKMLLCTLAICVVGLLVEPAYGCTCIKSDNPEKDPVKVQEMLRHYYLTEFHGALFTGTVISVERVKRIDWEFGAPENKVSIEVEDYWLGITDRRTIVYTGIGDGDCGVNFDVGRKYFFLPQYVEGKLRAVICDYDSKDSMLPEGNAASRLDAILGNRKKFNSKPKNS